MIELRQYGSIDRFAQMLQDDIGISTNPSLLGSVHHHFGIIYLNRGQYKESSEHFDKSLNVYLTFIPADHSSLSPTYSSIGSVHLCQSNYDKALTFYQLALDCQTNASEPDLESIIRDTKSIAYTYNSVGNSREALIYYQRVLELQKQFLGENDPSIAETYSSISALCLQQGDFMGAS